MDSETIRIGRDRLLRVFRYLEALNEHRNPAKRRIGEQLWTLWLKDLPDHPSIRKGSSPNAEVSALVASDDGSPAERQESDFILKIARPRLTNPPTPPALVEPWLEAGWENPFKEVLTLEFRNEASTGGAVRVRLGGDPKRVAALDQWKARRDQWARDEAPARAAMKIFEEFYELYGRVEREAERVEIVLGDAILSWRRPEGTVYHPILLQRLQLSFSPSVPEFTLTETEHPVELYSALFQSMPDVDGRAIGCCRDELELEGYSPLDDGPTSTFLERLVVQLSPRGEFVESGAPEGETDNPRVGRQPVLFLRPRTLGFAAAIEAVLEDLRNRNDLPWSLLNIVGLEPPPPDLEGTDRLSTRSPEDADILLSKTANPEQLRIARRLEHSGGVLVQGPPGTGKTYTIGNLIGHLLAEGKSVLVTSHTTKALRMVRSQIVPELRSLGVSLLENDLDSRMQLESAVSTIADRLSKTDAKSLALEADGLTQERAGLLSRLEELRQQLADARSDEYRDVAIGEKTWSPSEAARKITRESEINGWIPGPIQADIDLPLSGGELAELYATNRSISPDVESELSGHLPGPEELPSPADFQDLLLEKARLEKGDHNFRSDLWQGGRGPTSAGVLNETAIKLKESVDILASSERWKLAVLYAGKNGGPHREAWEKLLALVEQVHLEAADAQEILIQHATTLADESHLEQHEQTATEIHGHMRSGGSLGFFSLLTHRRWKQFVQTTRVDGDQPKLPDHFLAASKFSRVKLLRRNLATRWDRQMAPLGASSSTEMGTEIEKGAIQFCGPIRDCLAWYSQVWGPTEKELRETGFLWDKFLSEQPVVVGDDGELVGLRRAVQDSLPPILAARCDHLKWIEINQKLAELRERLKVAIRSFPDSHAIASLREAVDSLDSRAYRRGYTRLLELHELRRNLQRRNMLLAQLEAAAPAWAAAIRSRNGSHAGATVPGDPSQAWMWRQIHDELDRRASVSIDDLQTSIQRMTGQLQATTIDLIDNRAWMFQARRTSLPQRQALIGWLDTIRKIGKGTGIRAPRLRAEAAHKMTECWGAVPVWVMPLSRVVENFDPAKSRFDVVIIDEASQSDVMALVALYLGHSVVVVGDHEQVSPSAVGQEAAVIQNLIDQFLQGIPNAHLYDGQTSVYDLARQSFGETVRLVEHFRCVTEIIQFSNQLSYDGDIKTLRDASHVRLRPHVVAFHVPGSTRDGKVNHQEAKVIAALIAAALEQAEYQTNEFGRPSSFGVVSLVGEEQALEIDRLLRTHLAPDVYERHRLLCGTSAQFQGDERDVVFVSVVDAPANGALYFRDQQMFKQRYNVAASRARDQMWVVHSLDPQTDLQPGDLRRRLIEHAQAPELLTRTLDGQERRVQSALERDVMKRLVQAGYHVIPQWKVGSQSIDLVVEGDGKRLAIECDGDRDLPIEKLRHDIQRQSMLERLGWTFARVRGSIFFREPDRAMQPIFDKLRSLDIPPKDPASDSANVSPSLNELTERVIRRAEELRQEWSGPRDKRRPRSQPSESLA
jgi:very-short-patch-repair endonuclease/cellulose biosynthesis protein BcsQ